MRVISYEGDQTRVIRYEGDHHCWWSDMSVVTYKCDQL